MKSKKTSRKPSEKPPKDINAPVRPMSSYFLFNNERRRQLMSQNKNLKITEASKLIADEWKGISKEAKKVYEDEALKLKKTYETKFENYKKTDSYKQHCINMKQWKQQQKDQEYMNENNNKPIKPKDDTAPKKPQSSYFIFTNERRPQLQQQCPTKKITELSSMIAQEWKAMSQDLKKKHMKKKQKL